MKASPEDRSMPKRRRPRSPLRLERLEPRDTPTLLVPRQLETLEPEIALPTTGTELIAITASAQPLLDIQNVTGGFGLSSSIDSARTEVVFQSKGFSVVQVGLRPGANADSIRQTLDQTGLYSSVSPNFVYSGVGVAGVDLRERLPNDPSLGGQYHHPIISTPAAWDRTIGTPDVVVAILDDGVDITHPDLVGTVWRNTRENPNDGIDNDRNGFTDDGFGWDFVNNRNTVTPDDPRIDSHGTNVAGLLAAQFDNGIGLAGVAGGVRYMPLKVVNTAGSTTSLSLTRAIGYAVQNGAKIINTSINIDAFANDSSYRAATSFAYDQGLLLVNSAGNQNVENPGRFDIEDALFVSATDRLDVKTPYSNYGDGADLSAPGGVGSDGLLTTTPGGGYGPAFGTSMASPLAAGVAALVWSAFPGYTRDQVAATVAATADDLDPKNPAFEDRLGSGRVNAGKAVSGEKIVTRLGKLDGLPAEGAESPASISTFRLRLESPLDAGTVAINNFEFRAAGQDNEFGTDDDTLLPLSFVDPEKPYKIGTNSLNFALNQPLDRGLYRFTARSGGLADPFGSPVDGDGDRKAGGDLVRTFGVAYEVSGRVYDDLDDDGFSDPTEPGLSGRTVYADSNRNGVLDRVTFSLGNGRVLIPDGVGSLRQTTVVSGFGQPASGLSVSVLVTNPRPADLQMFLITPDGRSRLLFRNRPVQPPVDGGDSLFIFEEGIDESTDVVGQTTVHRLRPAESFRDLFQTPADGEWTIEVIDTVANEPGELSSAGFTLAAEPTAVTDVNGFFSFDRLPPGQLFLNVLTNSVWSRSANAGFIPVDPDNPIPLSLGLSRSSGVTGRVVADPTDDLENTLVYVDRNGNGVPDAGDILTATDPLGNFTFPDLIPGDYDLRLVLPAGFVPVAGEDVLQPVRLTPTQPVTRGVDFRLQRDVTVVRASVTPVTPDVRNRPLEALDFRLSEPIADLSLSSLSLLRDGVAVPLGTSTLTNLGSGNYRLVGLRDATTADGRYTFTVSAPPPAGQPDRRPVPASRSFVVDVTPPVAAAEALVANDNRVIGGTVMLSESVTGLAVSSFILTRDGQPLPLTNSQLTIALDGKSATLRLPDALVAPAGEYRLTLVGTGSTVRDQSGNALVADTPVNWVVTSPSSQKVVVSRTLIGTDVGGPPAVLVIDPTTGKTVQRLTVFEPGFTGGVRVSAADVTGDGVDDVIAVTGPGRATQLKIINGATFSDVVTIDVFEEAFRGGLFVSSADLNGDGRAEIVVSPDMGGGPRIRIYDGRTFLPMADFFGIEDPNFRGGARTTLGDINKDGSPDVIVAAGIGGGPRVAIFDGQSISGDRRKLVNDFFAFEHTLRNGVFLAAGDLDGDGFADVVFGGGPGGGPRVLAVSGQVLLNNERVAVADFFAGPTTDRGGVRVTVKTVDDDPLGDLVTANGVGGTPRAYLARDLRSGDSTTFALLPGFDDFTGGVFVG
jgi:hypothetical protein